ncbi:MAG TPA: hypothetical protein C5S37_11550 [Methanophagales archaeon]|nr:hypothetical protein [Methanophagales archaeon]HJH27369.1 hypothetical protein [Methanophagales archaeon]
MKKRQIQALGLIAVAILILTSALVYELALSPVIVEGVIEWKGITGVKDNTHSTIITNRPSEGEYRILVRDKEYKGFFRDIGNAEVNESLEDKLKADYSNLNYYVEITVDSIDPVNNLGKGCAYGYSVSREDFNRVQVWDEVRYEVSRWSELPRIKKFLEVDRGEWMGLLSTLAEKDESVRELIEGKSYKVVIGSRTSKNYGEEFVMVGGKPYKITIYLNNETVKSIEEVKDQEQLRMIQRVIELQNEISITVKPLHEI